ncbi:MAG TPA: hypothetical protein VEX86_05275 [Longimicrobium sp.]|nr:hypothetical protein [Longimicrobium sp.]
MSDTVGTAPRIGFGSGARYGTAAEGTPLPIVVRRAGSEVTLNGNVRFVPVITTQIAPDPNASAKAVRIRNGIVRGETGGG